MARTAKKTYIEKLEDEVKSNKSNLNLILGVLIVLVAGILLYNYFNRNKSDLGPAQQTKQDDQQEDDVSPDNLPGKYTVKEGDTLFLIAEKYYGDGFKYTEIVTENNLQNENNIAIGQVLEIPKVEGETPSVTPTEMPSPTEPTSTPEPTAAPETKESTEKGGQATDFGPAITGESYTVVEGDWLSTIAARTYGDVMAYPKLAQVNSIQNPDLIYPGQLLKIPR